MKKSLLTALLALSASYSVNAELLTFNDQTLDGSVISSANGFNFRQSNIDPINFALAFDGSSSSFGNQANVNTSNTLVGSQLRQLTTQAFDFSGGGNISFDLLIGGSGQTTFGSFENADTSGGTTPSGLSVTGEDVGLFYSVDNGTTFTLAQVFDTESPATLDAFGLVSFVLPTAAQTSNTMFQIIQLNNSGAPFDHWAIDNLSITATASEVSEPASLAIFGLSLVGLYARRKQKG